MNLQKILTEKSSSNKEMLNISLLSIASCISLFGTSAYNFAIGLYVLKITDSGLSFATTMVLGILSVIIVNPFAGVFADRFDKKYVSIISDILNGFLLIVLYLLTVKYNLSLPLVYLVTFLLNVFTTLYGITIEAAKPNLMSKNKLISMNSISKIIESTSTILGPMIGGIIFAFLDIRFFIIVNAISFIISGLLHLFIDYKFNYTHTEITKNKISLFTDIYEGFAYLKNKKNIINLFYIFTVLNFFIGFSINIPMPYIINSTLKLSSKSFGIIQSFFPVGMILGAIIIKPVILKYSYEKILKSTGVLLSMCMIFIGIAPILHNKIDNELFFVIYFIIIMFFIGVFIAFIDIPLFNILQQTISDEFRGRVLSIVISAAKTILPIALLIAGALINHAPSYLLPIIGGSLFFIFSITNIKTT